MKIWRQHPRFVMLLLVSAGIVGWHTEPRYARAIQDMFENGPAAPSRQAVPRTPGQVQLKLDRKLPEVRFDNVPMSDAVDFFQDVGDVPFRVDWTAMSAILDTVYCVFPGKVCGWEISKGRFQAFYCAIQRGSRFAEPGPWHWEQGAPRDMDLGLTGQLPEWSYQFAGFSIRQRRAVYVMREVMLPWWVVVLSAAVLPTTWIWTWRRRRTSANPDCAVVAATISAPPRSGVRSVARFRQR